MAKMIVLMLTPGVPRGLSSHSDTSILCNASGFVKIILSKPRGPTLRTTGPYSLTHLVCGAAGSSRIIVANWPTNGLPSGGPGILRNGERKYGHRKT